MTEDSSAIAISVVIPCRNAASVIGHQLEALCRQTCLRPWEVIVVDNNSTDDTRKAVERFQDCLPRLRLVQASGRSGAAHARNVGVEAARGENVAFCDADDEVGGGWLAAVDAALMEHEAIAFRIETEKLNGPSPHRRVPQSEGLQQYTYPPYLPYSGATIALRRRLHQALGGFDESMLACEDADFSWRLQHTGVKLHFAADAIMHVRLRSSVRDMCRQARLWGEYNVVLYKKFRPLGMPPLRRLPGLRNLLGIFRRVPQLASARNRQGWLWEASWATGRLIGSVKYRVWAL
jgi:glycosyltransferase involved in cell wall biosynthesis